MVGGVVYSTAGSRRAVVALDAVTGELLWMHSENEAKRGEAAPRKLSGRGLAYWTDGAGGAHRLRDARLSAGRARREDRRARRRDSARTASSISKLDDDQEIDLVTGEDRPACGADRGEGRRSSSARRTCRAAHRRAGRNVKGYVRGFDVRTGKRLWIFHTIPRPGEFGNDTWEKDSWRTPATPACGRR